MKKLLSAALVLWIFLFQAVYAEKSDPISKKPSRPATIKVLIKKESTGALLEVKGSYTVNDLRTNKRLSSGSRNKRYYLHPHKEGIKWGEDFLGVFQLQIVPTSADTTILVDGIQYKGTLEIFNINEQIILINDIDIENYIKSILTPLFPISYLPSVMDSIAVIARTDAYYRVLLNRNSFWHVDAKEVDYQGYGVIALHPHIDQAVDATRYLILTYENQPFPSTWNKNCAGKTASYSAIFRKNIPTPKGVYSNLTGRDREEARWSFSVEASKLAKLAKTNRVSEIDLFIDHTSNKVYAIRIKDGIHHEDVDFFQLQHTFPQILSNDFTVSLRGNAVLFEGFGEGCGVGVCIYSATQMAEHQELAPKILSHFYPNTLLQKTPSLAHMALLPVKDFVEGELHASP